MVISFMVEEARKRLEEKGFVYTLRRDKRKKVGYDWYNYFRTDTKKGNVIITFIGLFFKIDRRLDAFVIFSGFNSIEEWLEKAGESRYLYKVELIKERKKSKKKDLYKPFNMLNLSPQQWKHLEKIAQKRRES